MEEQTTRLALKPEFDPFKAMDTLDDEAILAEIEGRVVNTWVYQFPQDGKEVTGLSKVGVDAACREMAMRGEVIREEDVEYQVDPTDNRYVLFKAFASRVAVNKEGQEVKLDRTAGTKRQCIFVVTRDEGITNRPNNFWFEQGSIKALRNARMRLISEEVRAKIITLAVAQGKTHKVQPQGQEQKEHWCEKHKTKWFKRGRMPNYAHPIDGTDPVEWCNEPSAKPQAKTAVAEPEGKPETPQEALQQVLQPAESQPSPIDLDWLRDALQVKLQWHDAGAYLAKKYKVTGKKVSEMVAQLTSEQAKEFGAEVQSRLEAGGF